MKSNNVTPGSTIVMDAPNRPWRCARCQAYTSYAHSAGMLQCSYHPHVNGFMRPVRSTVGTASIDAIKSTGGCVVCLSSYGPADVPLLTRGNLHGCTSVDHVPASEGDFAAFLSTRPYELFPAVEEITERYCVFTHPTQMKLLRTARPRAPILIQNEDDVANPEDGSPRFVRMRLFGPAAIDCGIAEAGDAHLLSLVELYNECAARNNYAGFSKNEWERNVLHRNRHVLGSAVAAMREEDVFTRELYETNDEDGAQSSLFAEYLRAGFVPFYIVPRVECAEFELQ